MSDFLASMPAAYARAFTAAQIAEHARIVARRRTRIAHAELCKGDSGSVVCIVADDRPGLLALITDALLVQGFGIASAQAYCRQRADGYPEAVDFLELRHAPHRGAGGGSASIELSELDAIVQALNELIADDIRVSVRTQALTRPSSSGTRVYFELEALKRGEYLLLVETPDADGLLHAITSALHAQAVRILTCHIGTEDGLARDQFEIESIGGQPLSQGELCDVQLAVLDALPRARPSRDPLSDPRASDD